MNAGGQVDVTENLWIPLADGRRLAARLWLPAGGAPAGAVIEYVPYRKRDQTRSRDEPMHHWFAAHGYAAIRVDMRGSGDSDGVLAQEFERGEQDDGLEMLAWVAAQPWCNGRVAMIGKSWGGFAAAQLAVRKPPALRGIIAVCAAADRYDQSLHYTGGALLNEQLWLNDGLLLFNMRPPDPAISGDGWHRKWLQRLEAAEPWLPEWLSHQRRDAYWQHGSAGEAFDAIECAVFAVGGWADYISPAVLHYVEGVRAPVWGLVGPWGHHYPQDGVPGPAIGFLEECARFLAYCLDDKPEAMAETPRLRVWMPDGRCPGPTHHPQTGRWVAEPSWPAPGIASHRLHLGAGVLAATPEEGRTLTHRSRQSIGLCSPEWTSVGVRDEAPVDQSPDDAASLTFDGPVLAERLEILGSPRLTLRLRVDRPVANLAVRLCDVDPAGVSTRVGLKVLNLTHRNGHAAPEPLVPGETYTVTVTLPETAYAFRPGHHIRLALSTSFWPVVWPSPAPVTLTVETGGSTLDLPVRPKEKEDAEAIAFAPPSAGPPTKVTVLEPATVSRRSWLGPGGSHDYELICDGGFIGPGRRFRLDDTGTVLGHRLEKHSTIRDDDPLSAAIEIRQQMEFARDDWQVELATRTRFWSTATDYCGEVEARASEGGVTVFERYWRFNVPRDLS